jgi:multisubunit Na+/H+ antiporter MnhF subunit
VNAFTIAGTVLLCGFVPCGWVILRAPRAIEAVVALELCGTLATLTLLCLALGFQNTSAFNLPVVCAFVTWVGGLIYVRFVGRRL